MKANVCSRCRFWIFEYQEKYELVCKTLKRTKNELKMIKEEQSSNYSALNCCIDVLHVDTQKN